MALQPEQSSMYLVCPGRPNPTPSMAPTSNSPEPSISKLANKNKKDKEPGPPQSQPSQAIMTEESMYDKLEFNAHGSAEDELKHQKLRAELTRFSSSDIQVFYTTYKRLPFTTASRLLTERNWLSTKKLYVGSHV